MIQDPDNRAHLTPESAVRFAHKIAGLCLRGEGADAAQIVLLLGANEYERGKREARPRAE